jgi:hypothetical protein
MKVLSASTRTGATTATSSSRVPTASSRTSATASTSAS